MCVRWGLICPLIGRGTPARILHVCQVRINLSSHWTRDPRQNPTYVSGEDESVLSLGEGPPPESHMCVRWAWLLFLIGRGTPARIPHVFQVSLNLLSYWARDTRQNPTCVSGEDESVLSLGEGPPPESHMCVRWAWICFLIGQETLARIPHVCQVSLTLLSYWTRDTRQTPTCVSGEPDSAFSLDKRHSPYSHMCVRWAWLCLLIGRETRAILPHVCQVSLTLPSHWTRDTRHTPTCVSGESGAVLSLDEGRGIEGLGFKWFDLCFFILYDTCTVKRPILKSSLMRQIVPLKYINTLLKRSIPKKPR